MQKGFQILSSAAVPLPVENIDTDQIIPARFLKSTTRIGFGKNLFRDWRFYNDDEHSIREDFVLNDTRYQGKILVTGKNFGCGSSREHAAWAVKDYGFQAVVSSSFADIFKNNALNNFLLPVQLNQLILDTLFEAIFKLPALQITIDVVNQRFEVRDLNINEHFDMDTYKKECFINGYDDIEYLLSLKEEIEAFEKKAYAY